MIKYFQKQKKCYLIKISIICLFFILFISVINNKNNVFAYTASKAEVVLEAESGRVLYAKNENQKLPMASTTKIITAITAIENADISDEVVINEKTCNIEGSSFYLKEGDIFTLKDLLFGLMLRSGNDCAETIALYVGKTRENFIKMMNDTCNKIGCTNTNLTNPHGLPDDNHYTSALDLAKISAYSMKNDVFKEIVSTKKTVIIEKSKGEKRVLINKNKMLLTFDGANGIKTGYTKKAGRCLVSSAKRGEMQLVCVVINSPQMFERSSELLNNSFLEYEYRCIFDNKELRKKCNLLDFSIVSANNKFYYPLKKTEQLKIQYEMFSFRDFPVKNGENICKIEIFNKNELLFSEKIYTINTIKSKTTLKRVQEKLMSYFSEKYENK